LKLTSWSIMATSGSEARVLSIQSHVVSGYVGNKSACFPLQVLGFETDTINSVQFSNHTGYAGGFKGRRLEDVELGELVEGLKDNDLLDQYSHVITGYVGTPTFLRDLGQTIKAFKAKNPEVKYVCDPVMGDVEPVGWYVPHSLLPIYREEIVPLADVCIPNEFELALLTEIEVKDEASAVAALRKLNQMGVETAVVSSCRFNGSSVLACYASKKSTGQVAKIEFPRLPVAFVGSGDLFTAMFTAWLTKHDGDIFAALEYTVGVMRAVLGRTMDYVDRKRQGCGLQPGDSPPAHLKELRLIQSKADIENPTVISKAVKIA